MYRFRFSWAVWCVLLLAAPSPAGVYWNFGYVPHHGGGGRVPVVGNYSTFTPIQYAAPMAYVPATNYSVVTTHSYVPVQNHSVVTNYSVLDNPNNLGANRNQSNLSTDQRLIDALNRIADEIAKSEAGQQRRFNEMHKVPAGQAPNQPINPGFVPGKPPEKKTTFDKKIEDGKKQLDDLLVTIQKGSTDSTARNRD